MHTSTPSPQEAEAGLSLQAGEEPTLSNKFQASQGSMVRSCLIEKRKTSFHPFLPAPFLTLRFSLPNSSCK